MEAPLTIIWADQSDLWEFTDSGTPDALARTLAQIPEHLDDQGQKAV